MLYYGTIEERRIRKIIDGNALDSMLGPGILNMDYNDIPGLEGLPECTSNVAYVDNIVLYIRV